VSCYRLIDAEKAHHQVSQLCRVLGVARAGFYAWASRPPSARAVADAALVEQIRDIHARSRGTYGAPRVHAELRLGLGVRAGRKRVARLMRSAGIIGVHRRRRHGLTRRDPAAASAPDLVERRFTPPAPDRLWVADITQQRTDEGWLYLAVVLDAFSRRVVGWSMADHLRTELVLDALDMAITQRNPAPGLVHHTDHGCQRSTPAWPSAAASSRPVWSPRWAPSATRWTTPWLRASSPPWNVSCSTATPGPPAKGCAQPCSTSSRSSTTANAATRPWATRALPAMSSTHQPHPPHNHRVHESGATPTLVGQLRIATPPVGWPTPPTGVQHRPSRVGEDRNHTADGTALTNFTSSTDPRRSVRIATGSSPVSWSRIARRSTDPSGR
jgi:putative transposase